MADRHETVLPSAPEAAREALTQALDHGDEDEKRAAVGRVVAEYPAFVQGWVELSMLGREPIERYAYARVGYHRGLDALRANGWGGRGFVRWSKETNRPFLSCLAHLRAAADEIGERSEVDRLHAFLHELDPAWDDGNVTR
jgi:hypothetical protein